MHREVQLQYWPVSSACQLKINANKRLNYVKFWTLDTLTEWSYGHKDEHGERVKKERDG